MFTEPDASELNTVALCAYNHARVVWGHTESNVVKSSITLCVCVRGVRTDLVVRHNDNLHRQTGT